MEESTSIQTLISALMDESSPLPARLLYQLSDLSAMDAGTLRAAWASLPLTRRRNLLSDLVDLSEQDTLLMFREIGLISLTDPDDQVVVSAIDLLFEEEDRQLVPSLLSLLASQSRSEAVRAAAANALSPFVLMGEVEKLPASQLTEIEVGLLAAYRHDSSDLVRRRALESLGFSSHAEVPHLLRSAYASSDENWLESAMFAMGRSADEQWEPNILETLAHEDPAVRAQACHAAGELGLQKARASLIKALRQEKLSDIRQEIIWALGQIGGPGVQQALEKVMDESEDEDEIQLIEEALSELEFAEGNPTFELMDVPEPEEGHHHGSPEASTEPDSDEFEEEDSLFHRSAREDEEWQRYVSDDDDQEDEFADDEYDDDDDFDWDDEFDDREDE